MFLSLDRGKSWTRLKAELPTVRMDEITLHPRDNAMIVAHARPLASGSSITSSRSRNTPRRRPVRPTRSSSRRARRCSGSSGTTGTTSSGAISLPRRKSADRSGDPVQPEERGQGREAEDHRRGRQGSSRSRPCRPTATQAGIQTSAGTCAWIRSRRSAGDAAAGRHECGGGGRGGGRAAAAAAQPPPGVPGAGILNPCTGGAGGGGGGRGGGRGGLAAAPIAGRT